MLRRGQSLSGCPLAGLEFNDKLGIEPGRLAELSNLPITTFQE